MVISFLDGTKVVEPGITSALKRRLCSLIKGEDSVTFYFFTTSDFMLECEWLVRELQALYPGKRMERVAMVTTDDDTFFARCRFDRFEHTERKLRTDIWRWMVDQSDYVCGYMHPALCSSRDRLTAWNYAYKHLQDRCFNFASEDAWLHISAQIPTLVRWQGEALERKLRGESQGAIAQALGISRSTVRAHEISAQHSLIQPNIPPRVQRVCAVLGLGALEIPMSQRELLMETIRYLVYHCGVSCFLVQTAVTQQHTQLLNILRSECRRFTRKTEIRSLPLTDVRPAFPSVNPETGRIKRNLQEREDMIDEADVVLCSVENLYGSGISYAKRKHVPVINLAEMKI